MTKIPSWRRGLGVTIALAFIVLIVPGTHAQLQDEVVRGGQDPGSYLISVDVDLVVLPVTVRDRQGQPVLGLLAADFRVYEDRVAQQIRLFQHEDIPVIAGILVDHSGSMQPKMAEVSRRRPGFCAVQQPRGSHVRGEF